MNKTTKTTNRVLIIEDKFAVAEGLNTQISRHPDLSVAGMAYDVATGIRLLKDLKPRIVLMDLGLPDGTGFEILEEVQNVKWKCDAIVISMMGDEDSVMRALSLGAIGYLQKTDLTDDISKYVQSVLEGGAPMSPKVASYLLRKLTKNKGEKSVSIDILTNREHDVLDLLAKGFKRREIAEHFSISPGTVGVHVSRIYQKLGVNSNIEAINVAAKHQASR